MLKSILLVRWDLEVWPPGARMNGMSALMKETLESCLAPSTTPAVRRQPSVNQEAGSHQTQNLLVPWSWTSPSLQMWETISIVYNLWYSAIIVWMDWDTRLNCLVQKFSFNPGIKKTWKHELWQKRGQIESPKKRKHRAPKRHCPIPNVFLLHLAIYRNLDMNAWNIFFF